MKRSEILFSVLKLPIDAAALTAGFWLAYQFRDAFGTPGVESLGSLTEELSYIPSGPLQSIDTYFHYLGYIIPGMLVIFAIVGLYAIRSQASWYQRFLRILIGVSVGEFGILLLFLLKANFFLPRSTVLYSWVLCTALVLLGRGALRGVQKLLYSRGIGTIGVVILGSSKGAEKVVHQIEGKPYRSYRLISRISDADVDSVLKQLESLAFEELVIVSNGYSTEDLAAIRNYCLENHISFSFVPALLTALESSFEVRELVGLPVVEVRPTPLEGWGRVVKRIFDVVGASAFLILLSPVLLGIAAIMKVTDPGPLIYKHLRFGRNKKPIYVWKFRSMKIEFCTGSGYDGDKIFAETLAKNPELKAEWDATFKLKDDFRISSIGRLLRKTSLDELPQFFNVLRGDLSLVGPRPIIKDEVKKYGETARILFSVRPGITGPWQISGRNDVSYDERIAFDSYYIEHWNVLTDLWIVIKTGLVVIGDVLRTLSGRKSSGY